MMSARDEENEMYNDEDREALVRTIVSVRGTHYFDQAARALADAILGAGFTLASRPQVAPGPLRVKFDGGRNAVLDESDTIVGYLDGSPQAAPSGMVEFPPFAPVEDRRAFLVATSNQAQRGSVPVGQKDVADAAARRIAAQAGSRIVKINVPKHASDGENES